MGLTAAQRRCAILIGRGLTYSEAGKAIGVGTRQVERWMSPSSGIPGMRELAAAEREQVFEPGALDTLRQLLSSKSETIRLNAAKALLVQPPDPAASLIPAGRVQSGPNAGGGFVTINMWTLPDGTTTLIPPEGWDPETETIIDADAVEVIDAEAEETPAIPRGTASCVGIPDNAFDA